MKHILRERFALLLLDQSLVLGDKIAPVGGGHLGVAEVALLLLGHVERFLEQPVVEAEDDVGVHLDEAAVGVPREALIARGLREALHGGVVETQVEHGVHHARHRHAGARADRDEERVGGIAEALADRLLDVGQSLNHLRRATRRRSLRLPRGSGRTRRWRW